MRKLILLACLAMTACGGTSVKPQGLPSTSVAVPCSESAECVQRVAAGEAILTCTEQYFGYQFMSSWDGGKTWLNGNCDATHPDNGED